MWTGNSSVSVSRPRISWLNELECENPACAHRGFFRRVLRRRANVGVFLQGRWYCSPECFEQSIAAVFAGLIESPDEPLHQAHRVPLGLLLLGRGLITDTQLKCALQAQRESGTGRLGRWLVEMGSVSPLDISAALAAQWGCALFPLESDRRYREFSQMIPFALLESARMLPVHYSPSSQMLFVAFSEDVDHTALYSIERLLGGRTEPCVVTESAMHHALEEARAAGRPTEIVFETMWDASEMARTVREYAMKLGAEELRLARPRRFLWVRLSAAGQSWDLLFRLHQRKAA